MFEILYQTNNATIHQEIEQFLKEWNDDQNDVFVKTSGSTGEPKQITLNKEHMRASARMTIEFLNLKKNGTSLLCLSPTSIAGKMMIVRSMLNDMRLLVVDPSSNPLDTLSDPIDFCAMVPLQVKACLEQSGEKLKNIGTLIIGGAPINNALRNDIVNSEMNAYQTFGMTETISHIAMRKVNKEDLSYELLPGISMESVDHAMKVNAPHLGVHGLQTNDLIEVIDQKHFVWLGRRDFVINSGGIKIHPEQVEAKIGGYLQMPFFSYGIHDEKLGEKHILCIEGKDSLDKQVLGELLNKYEIPKEIYFFKNFNYTYTGKIDRKATISRLNDAEKEIL